MVSLSPSTYAKWCKFLTPFSCSTLGGDTLWALETACAFTLILGGSNTLRMEPTSTTIAPDHEFPFPGFFAGAILFS